MVNAYWKLIWCFNFRSNWNIWSKFNINLEYQYISRTTYQKMTPSFKIRTNIETNGSFMEEKTSIFPRSVVYILFLIVKLRWFIRHTLLAFKLVNWPTTTLYISTWLMAIIDVIGRTRDDNYEIPVNNFQILPISNFL